MKNKYLLLALISVVVVFAFMLSSCSDDKKTIVNGDSEDLELYIRDNADQTILPLVLGKSWQFKKNKGDEEKPDRFIKNLLLNDEIVEQRILPIREYDKGDGIGKYKYKTLCYLTSAGFAYFYMDDKLLVGSYLDSDANGNASVTWEYELPALYSETSSGYYLLDRSVNTGNSNMSISEYSLYECPGYHVVDVELTGVDVKRYKDCKRFIYNNIKHSQAPEQKINVFYFKQGIGLVKYQQFLKISETAVDSVLLYEQVINEK